MARNDPCPCGSGKKYKKCCMSRDKGGRAATPVRQSMAEEPIPPPHKDRRMTLRMVTGNA
ncbi:MAG: SEC-C metal-binding domain-containing protein [bacterium]